MPKGVEHYDDIRHRRNGQRGVNGSEMPKGVEHKGIDGFNGMSYDL